MKKTVLAIALAAVMTPFVFAAQTTGANAGTPAATSKAKTKKAKATKKGNKSAKAKTTATTPQK
jgi:hypothetical protein